MDTLMGILVLTLIVVGGALTAYTHASNHDAYLEHKKFCVEQHVGDKQGYIECMEMY